MDVKFSRMSLVSIALIVMYLPKEVVSERRLLDLSHSLNSNTHRWPTNPGFELTVQANGTTDAGFWYGSNIVSFSEHTGTHLDAPAHFAMRDGIYYSSTIPLERLVGSVSLINLAEKAAKNRDYRVTPEDITDWEKTYGTIPAGAIVLLNFEWAKYWNSYADVFGSDSNDTSTFHFPGVGIEAAKLLAKREIYGLGIDTPSLDYGPSSDFPTHIFLLEKNIYFLENVGDMSQLPAGGKGVTLVVGVMKIDGGTGGPARLIAMWDSEVESSALRLGCSGLFLLLCYLLTLA